jgi:hypothetical protein
MSGFVCDHWSRYDNATSSAITDIYRTFASIHTALGPYFLAAGAAAFENNSSAMIFTDDTTYLLGDDILVAPLLSNESNSRSVHFPGNANWVNWFTNETHVGGSIIATFGALAHYTSPFDRSLDPKGPPPLVFVITHPVSAGMTCVRQGQSSNLSSFVAEYFHNDRGFTLLSARKRGAHSVAFVMVIHPIISAIIMYRSQRNTSPQSPVDRPLRVYLPLQQRAALVESQVLWSHVGSSLTIILAENVDDVQVDWV